MDLEPEAEEVATFIAKYLDTAHVQKPVFTRNFWKDFRYDFHLSYDMLLIVCKYTIKIKEYNVNQHKHHHHTIITSSHHHHIIIKRIFNEGSEETDEGL